MGIVLLTFCIFAETVEQLLYRVASRVPTASAKRWALPIALHLAGFTAWLGLLRLWPLGVALPLTAIVNVTIPLAARQCLGERIDLYRWIGIAFVTAGFTVVATS